MSRCRPLTGHRALGLTVCLVVLAATCARGAERAEIPFEGRLTYSVSWLGVHCGEMTLESAQVVGKPALVRMRMTLRSSEFFDRVYRVRGEIESIYHVRRHSTLRFHEVSSEQDKSKDDLWVVALAAGKARRTYNGREQSFELPPGGAHDPLALLYRIRSLADAPGSEFSLTAMTTKGSLAVPVRVERWEQFDTAAGAVTALKVVQQPVGDEEFGRGGGMAMWLAADDQRTPYRIAFALPFGTLVADLIETDSADEG